MRNTSTHTVKTPGERTTIRVTFREDHRIVAIRDVRSPRQADALKARWLSGRPLR